MQTGEKMQKTIEYIKEKITSLNIKPEIGIVLGSGLGKIADEIEGIKIPYSEIPGFKSSTIEGHSGNFAIGELCSKNLIAMQGRLHFYEGYSLKDVVYPVQVMKFLGVQNLIVTNASGGINKSFNPGDLMIIEDHINFTGNNPLIGANIKELGPRFFDMSEAYSKDFIKLAQDTAKELNIDIKKGIYAGVTGPNYETPAEVKMLRMLGADAVGMSTVPEVIAANHAGLKVFGVSCITNMAAGVLDQPLNHEEVIETAGKVEEDFKKLIKIVVSKI